MSWNFSVPPTPRDEFAAAVDAAVASGQDEALPNVKEDVMEAREAMKRLGARVKRPYVAGSANGHSLQADESGNMHDGLHVQVTGSE